MLTTGNEIKNGWQCVSWTNATGNEQPETREYKENGRKWKQTEPDERKKWEHEAWSVCSMQYAQN